MENHGSFLAAIASRKMCANVRLHGELTSLCLPFSLRNIRFSIVSLVAHNAGSRTQSIMP
jgi:hypothetical protein